MRGEQSDILVEVRIRHSGADYFINGRPQKKDVLKDLRRTLKIDLNNLCQFLPQDREFEKSVGGEEFVSAGELIHA